MLRARVSNRIPKHTSLISGFVSFLSLIEDLNPITNSKETH